MYAPLNNVGISYDLLRYVRCFLLLYILGATMLLWVRLSLEHLDLRAELYVLHILMHRARSQDIYLCL